MPFQSTSVPLQVLKAHWQTWVLSILNQNTGGLLGGLVHNLHNHAHTLSMQAEMWEHSLSKAPDAPASSLQRSFQRIQTLSSEFSGECRTLSERTHLQSFEPALLPVHNTLEWLKKFWVHNLFFKHHVQFMIQQDKQVPQAVTLPPAPFVFCLEEGLKNALEALPPEAAHTGQPSPLHLDILMTSSGMDFELTSPTSLTTSLDPWQPGVSSKTGHLGLGLPLLWICCEHMGWQCDLQGDPKSTTLRLVIPADRPGQPVPAGRL